MKLYRCISLLAPAGLLLLPAAADAGDMPQRKSGLWQIETRTDAGGSMTLQVCVDAKTDNLAADNPNRNLRQRCPTIASKRVGNRIEIDTVCTLEGTTASSHAVVTGNMSSAYHMDSTTRFSPPIHGISQNHATMDGKWLGACKPGQQPGSVTVLGMPNGGSFRLSPDMLKQMQKMQQQYGH